MADNGLVPEDLTNESGSTPSANEANQPNERRAFMRKAALIGLPVLIATVQPRTAQAGGQKGTSASCLASMPTSHKC